jgi:hypothetical protein
MYLMTRKFTLLPVLLLAVSICAFGQLIDPATLHIGTGAGTACATGCGGDPNLVSGTNFDVYQNDGGAKDLTTPLLVILGIPDFTGVAPTITGVTTYSPYPGTGVVQASGFGIATKDYFGGTFALTGGASAMSTLTAGEEAYSDLGLADANNSNSFTNWSTFGAAAAGISTPSSYGLYVYELNFNLVANGLFDIFWSGLPTGTMAIAYGCQGEAAGSTSPCTINPNPFNTPFTESGAVGGPGPGPGPGPGEGPGGNPAEVPTVPEPNGIVLVGSALLALCAGLRKRLIRS